jgi:hypothetical protein
MILSALALLLADLAAQPQAPQPAAKIVVPAQTSVQFSTVDPLDSRSVKQGQRFALRVAEDVTVGSTLVIPRGTPAVGEVEAVSGKGMVGKAGRLVLRPLFVDVAGQRVNLVGVRVERGSDATTGVAVGSLLISGLGIFITGKSASVPAGSFLPGRVRSEVVLSGATAPAPAAPSSGAADSNAVQTPGSQPDHH